MFLKASLLLFMLIFSFVLFLINNFYIVTGILIVSVLISIKLKIKLPIYTSFVVLLLFNFTLNYLFSNFFNALMITERLIIMFVVVNIVIKKIGMNNIGKIIGKITKNEDLALMITISLSFIPILIKEVYEIRRSLVSKNFPLNFRNILFKPNVFVLTFFNNLFKRVGEMEKSFIARGVEE